MNSMRYLVAKYISDLRRMEPRNMGVVVWSPGGSACRFLGEKPEAPWNIDGRSIPSFVTSSSAYRQWIKFWRSSVDSDAIEPVTGGTPVAITDPRALEILKGTSSGNFILVDGGVILEPLSPEELGSVVNNLYAMLVEGPSDEPARDPTLEEVCAALVEEAKLASSPYYKPNYAVECPLPGTVERFNFSFAVANGTPKRLYQAVALSKKKAIQRKNVHDAAWMLEKVTAAKIVEKADATALVFAPDEIGEDPDVKNSIQILGSVGRVIDLSHRDEALEEFRTAAQLIH